MARPQPAPSSGLRRSRPESHVFEPQNDQATTPAPAVAATSNAAVAATGETATAAEALVKFSVRAPVPHHRHIKAYAAQNGLSIQDLSMDAIREYLEKRGAPLP